MAKRNAENKPAFVPYNWELHEKISKSTKADMRSVIYLPWIMSLFPSSVLRVCGSNICSTALGIEFNTLTGILLLSLAGLILCGLPLKNLTAY
jgi:hypothetical protein